ncbi:hypothetical protein M885DRAFT_617359 [Pelagophyceae sp. CCMP2097]|nr:hypothetical protein M885DRAFT_617359 [Pelagophyceae sp. CCMP2097]|mmetsp:Transcript_28659/g.96532  ORF Transcript_28659/g.96532 Transcript_28659/m.96532 type:complete len:178 (-) Transcript_28659:1179-1712(-)
MVRVRNAVAVLWLSSGAVALLPGAGRVSRCRVALSSQESDEVPGSGETISLQAQFERALVLQRCGDVDGALEEYDTFIAAAKQLNVSQKDYAEVLTNKGALHVKKGERKTARQCFEDALAGRNVGSAHVNLALLDIADRDVESARRRCLVAVELRDDPRTVATAQKLLADIAARTGR